MTNTKTYLVVTPNYVARRDTVQAALKLARACERNAQARHGAGAGADCAIIAESADGSLEYRGMACGTRLIGQSFGSAASYIRRASEALSVNAVRSSAP